MDPLEDVLSLLGTTSHLSTGLIAGGRWALRFPPPPGVKFNTVRRGRCYVRVEGLDEAIALREGDCFLLTQPRAFSLCSDLDLAPVDAQPIFEAAEDGMARTGDGEDVALIGGRFSFEDRARVLLLDALPPVIHVPAGTPEAASMQWALTQIESELRTRSVAATLVAEHLALVMLIHVLRLHLAGEPGSVSGWLTGLSDPIVATALNAMHADPARPWSVEQLARVSAVSRSTLAARFKSAVGTGPLEYLTGWRIELASHRLRHGNDTLGAIAQAIGYSSESALSNAFKRVTGPRHAPIDSSTLTAGEGTPTRRQSVPADSRPVGRVPRRRLASGRSGCDPRAKATAGRRTDVRRTYVRIGAPPARSAPGTT